MKTKLDIAVEYLALIKEDRAKIANAERATIPAALRMGISPERVAHLTGATVERVMELEKEGT